MILFTDCTVCMKKITLNYLWYHNYVHYHKFLLLVLWSSFLYCVQ